MLAELVPQSYEIRIGDACLYLRFDMNALLSLEREGLTYEDVFADEISGFTLLKFLRAGLTEQIGEEREIAVADALGIPALWTHLRAAVALSLPEYDPLIIPDNAPSDGKLDYARLRTLFCDVMKKPDELFWKSTLREIFARWQSFAVAKGYAEPPKKVQMYDTEGM